MNGVVLTGPRAASPDPPKSKRALSSPISMVTRIGMGSPPAPSSSSRVSSSCTRLAASGRSSAVIPQIAERLAPSYADLGKGSATALVEGVALAVEVQAEVQADVERNMKDVREVERLLGAFSGELEKLDEVLEVLAAYAQRMRAKPAKATRRVLH